MAASTLNVFQPVEGGCLCGQARYRLAAEPFTCYSCHCADCQRRTGSGFSTALIVPADGVELTAGASAPYRAALPGGRVKHGEHCAKCSTRLWGTLQAVPTIRVLQPGTLDEPGRFAPVAHLWTRSALPWTAIPSHLPSYPEQAPFAELVRLWQEARGRPMTGSA